MNRNLSNALKELKKLRNYDERHGVDYLEINLVFNRPNQPVKVYPLTKIRCSKRIIDRLMERRNRDA